MTTVALVSGGLDSTLMTVLSLEAGVDVDPVFINYGQLAFKREYEACIATFENLRLPKPVLVDLSGVGGAIQCGLTDSRFHIIDEAFLPGRNLLFLLIAAAYGYQNDSKTVAIGLLSEVNAIFPDQTEKFIRSAEATISLALAWPTRVLAPLMGFTKSDIVALAKKKNIIGTYSCHLGEKEPCGACIACLEYV